MCLWCFRITHHSPRSRFSAARKMLIYINQWTKYLNNVKFLNTHPVEKNSILSSYDVISEVFSNIGIYSKTPPPAPSPKVADLPSPLQTRPLPLILIALPLQQHQLLRLLVPLWMAAHRRRRWWNILEHYAI